MQGDRLAQVIEELRWTQRELAAASGVSQPTISRMIGGVHRSGTDSFWAVCDAIASEGRTEPGQVAAFLLGVQASLQLSPIMNHR